MRWAAIIFLVMGCAESSVVVCDDGRLCPENTKCGANACIPTTCGDDAIGPLEQCDRANFAGLDCTSFGFYDPGGLVCTDCVFDTSACMGGFCGDGAIDGPESCDGAAPTRTCGDYGFDIGRASCASSCTDDPSACERVGWTPIPSHTTADLHGVWGVASTDLITVGDGGTILHWDGVELAPMASPTTENLAAISGNYAAGITVAFAVGAHGTIARWDGTTWSTMPSSTTVDLRAVYVASKTRAFATGDSTVLRFDGTAWTTIPGAPTTEIHGVWDDGARTYVTGGSGGGAAWQIDRLDGMTWTNVVAAPAGSGGRLRAAYGFSTDAFFAGTLGRICHANPNLISCVAIYGEGRLYGLHGSSIQNMVAVGSDGAVFRSNGGTAWTRDVTGVAEDLNAVFAFSVGDVWAVGARGRVLHFNGNQRTSTRLQLTEWRDVWGDDAQSIWAAGQGGGAVWDRTTKVWTTLTGTSSTLAMNAIWGVGSRIVAVGDHGEVAHVTPGTPPKLDREVTSLSLTSTLRDVWGIGTTWFAVGYEGANGYVARDVTGGGAWATQPLPAGTGPLHAVFGSSATDVYAAGDGGAILHFDGTGWTSVRTGTGTLHGVWTDGVHVVAVGDEIVQRTTGGWIAIPQRRTLDGVWGPNANDLFAIGAQGAALHFDGLAWVRYETGTSLQLIGVGGDRQHVVFGAELGYLQLLERGAGAYESSCIDHWDNDVDGLTNCDDPNCMGNQRCFAGGTCRDASSIACGSPTHGDTFGGPLRIDVLACASAATLGPEAYYRYVPASAGPAHVHLANANPALSLAVFPANESWACSIGDCLGSGTDVTFTAEANATYFIVVDGPDGVPGAHDVVIDCP